MGSPRTRPSLSLRSSTCRATWPCSKPYAEASWRWKPPKKVCSASRRSCCRPRCGYQTPLPHARSTCCPTTAVVHLTTPYPTPPAARGATRSKVRPTPRTKSRPRDYTPRLVPWLVVGEAFVRSIVRVAFCKVLFAVRMGRRWFRLAPRMMVEPWRC